MAQPLSLHPPRTGPGEKPCCITLITTEGTASILLLQSSWTALAISTVQRELGVRSIGEQCSKSSLDSLSSFIAKPPKNPVLRSCLESQRPSLAPLTHR